MDYSFTSIVAMEGKYVWRELTFQLEETNCGNGILDIEQLIQHLQNYNHDMPVIIEHLDTDEEYLKSLTYVKKRLQDANVVF